MNSCRVLTSCRRFSLFVHSIDHLEDPSPSMYSFKKQMSGPGFFANAHPSDFETRPIDLNRPIKVIVIGGGMSGIIAGIFFPRNIENLELKIYEKNADLGGTWLENVYGTPASAFTKFCFSSIPVQSRYGSTSLLKNFGFLDTLASPATYRLTRTNSPLRAIPSGQATTHLARKSTHT